MKAGIHPKWYKEAKITCACGAEYVFGSTIESAKVELCAACHPTYTGVEKIVDIEGRVEKFTKRRAAASKKQTTKNKKQGGKSDEKQKSLKEMLDDAKKS